MPRNRGARAPPRGNVAETSPSFIKEAPYLSLSDIHTYRRLLGQDSWSRCARSTTASNSVMDTLGTLHRLRNTYVIFTSDNGFFFGEHRLIGGKFLAYEPATPPALPDPRPAHPRQHRIGELVGNIDIAPTILELAGVTPDKSVDGRSMTPFLQRPRTAHPAALPLRVLRRDLRRRGGRGDSPNRATRAAPRLALHRRSRPHSSGGAKQTGRGGEAPPPRSSRRPRTTRGSASAPTSTSPGPTGRRSSTTSMRTPTS